MNKTMTERWIAASFQKDFSPHTIEIIQGLGNLELELEIEESRIADIYKSNGNPSIEHSIPLTRLFMLSRLWLLGAYELVRLMDQRLRMLERDDEISRSLNDFKKTIGKYRMPLAKLERAGSHGEELIAWPFPFSSGEVGWRIENEAYSRRAFAASLLNILERMREADGL